MDNDLKKMGGISLVILILSLTVLIGIAIIQGVGDNMRTDTAVTNESLSIVNNTAVAFANTRVLDAYSVTAYNNSANTETIPSTEYAISYGSRNVDGGSITALDYDNSTGKIPGGVWYVSYTYSAATTSSGYANVYIAGLTVFATFSALISLVLVGKVIIKLIRGGMD